MWLLFGRLMRVVGRQLRQLIGAAIHPPTLLPENPTGLQLSFRCWLLGHEDLVRTTTGRLYLECMECGRQTPGWLTSKSWWAGKHGVLEAHVTQSITLAAHRRPATELR